MSASRFTHEERANVAWRAVCAKHGDAAKLCSLRREYPEQFRTNAVFQARWATIWADLRQLLDEDDAALQRVQLAREQDRKALSELIEQGAVRAGVERHSDEQRERRAKRRAGDALSQEILEILRHQPNIIAKRVEGLLRKRAGPDNTIREVSAEWIMWVKADGTLKVTRIAHLASRVSRLKKLLRNLR